MIYQWGIILRSTPYFTLDFFTYDLGDWGKIVRTTPLFLVRFKSDENNILRLAIHLFANQPIYYLLFD